MNATPSPAIADNSHVTLHYRLALPREDGEVDVVSTLGGTPATLQMGTHQLAPPLESLLIGLHAGDDRRFDLAAGVAFGPHNPTLVQRVSRSLLDRESRDEADYTVGDWVEFDAGSPNGQRFAGVLREFNDEYALFDFNHPLAGQPLIFEVQIIGVL